MSSIRSPPSSKAILPLSSAMHLHLSLLCQFYKHLAPDVTDGLISNLLLSLMMQAVGTPSIEERWGLSIPELGRSPTLNDYRQTYWHQIAHLLASDKIIEAEHQLECH